MAWRPQQGPRDSCPTPRKACDGLCVTQGGACPCPFMAGGGEGQPAGTQVPHPARGVALRPPSAHTHPPHLILTGPSWPLFPQTSLPSVSTGISCLTSCLWPSLSPWAPDPGSQDCQLPSPAGTWCIFPASVCAAQDGGLGLGSRDGTELRPLGVDPTWRPSWVTGATL